MRAILIDKKSCEGITSCVCSNEKKSECNDLQILFDLYSAEYSMKTGYLMFELLNSLFI